MRQQRGRAKGAPDLKTMLEKAKQLLKPTKRSDVQPFIVMDVMTAAAQREAQGAHIIHMEVGQPAAPSPATAIRAAQAALGHGRIGYTETLGIPSLRARIARLDRDTVAGKNDYELILAAFREHQYDILVGTQMIAKGHDIPNVTLVGIINADMGLGLPDFRAAWE